jgi:hypothetical protein
MKLAISLGLSRLLRSIRSVAAWVLVGALSTVAYPWAAGASVLDQAQTGPSDDVWRIGGGYRPEMAQIFTAGQYGFISDVAVYLDNLTAEGPVTVSIQTVIGGEPSGTELGRGEIPADTLPPYDQPGWVETAVRANILVLPGDQFAVVVASPSGTIRWFSTRNAYTGGFMLVNEGDGWINTWYDDAMFRTYVRPDELDQSQHVYGVLETIRLQTVGQVFTAGQTGFLARVVLFLRNGDLGCEPTTGLDVTIQTVTPDGYPSGATIGRGSLSYLSQSGSWVSIGIHGAYVTAGQKYVILLNGRDGCYYWGYVAPWYEHDYYPDGHRLYAQEGWLVYPYEDHAFQTYVATPLTFSPSPPPPLVSSHCAAGVCPAVKATITPAHSAARITSNVEFWARPDGSVHGVLTFNDSRTGDLLLQGCTTRSAACEVNVKTFACTAEDEIRVIGTYTVKGDNERYFELRLDGARDRVGTFTLRAKEQIHTLTRYGIVDVTCPPVTPP